MGRINVTSSIFAGAFGPQLATSTPCALLTSAFPVVGASVFSTLASCKIYCHIATFLARKLRRMDSKARQSPFGKLTWLVLGGDPAARSHRVEQFTAL